jgi:hypothetical protein
VLCVFVCVHIHTTQITKSIEIIDVCVFFYHRIYRDHNMTPFFLFFWCKFTWIPRNIPNKYEESLYERTSRDKIWFSRRLFSSAKPVCLSLWCHKYSFAMNIELSTTKSISFMIQDLLYNCQGEWVVWHHFAISKTLILAKIKEQRRFSFFFFF